MRWKMLLPLLLLLIAALPAHPQRTREEGEYRILVSGAEIGTERYVLVTSGEAITSTSRVDFRNPGEKRQKVHFESRLEMSPQLVPRRYELKTDVDGRKGKILGTFESGQAIFEYSGTSLPRKIGVLTGKDYSVLDTNVFHHFIFLARRFDFESSRKVQELDVVIPQESDSGTLRVSWVGAEKLQAKGANLETQRLNADSGALQIQLWVDRSRVVHKIVVPSKNLEVIRN